MSLRDPWFLLLLPVLLAALWLVYRKQRRYALSFPSTAGMEPLTRSMKRRLLPLLPAMRTVALVLLVIAIVRPQKGWQRVYTNQEGVDIVLTVDVSTSMLAEDFFVKGKRQNRLDVVKSVVSNFIDERSQDRLGMVVFAGNPYTISPLTWDHSWLKVRLGEIQAGMIEDGTGIGGALSTALNRLKDSEAKSKVVILLTDGVNNVNTISPETAAEAAKALGVKVYTIGAGSSGPVPYPMQDQFGRTVYHQVQIPIDEDLLSSIAGATGGKYFRATDAATLSSVYEQIDQLEKSDIHAPSYLHYTDYYPWFLLAALVLVLLEILLRQTVLRRLP